MFVLPYPPSANRYWRVFRGRAVKSPEARAYQANVQKQAQSQRFEGPVAVKIHAWKPSRRGDLDNLLKVALDALSGVAYDDDSQIAELEILFAGIDKQSPHLLVRVSECQSDAAATSLRASPKQKRASPRPKTAGRPRNAKAGLLRLVTPNTREAR